MESCRVLIIDDEKNLVKSLAYGLKRQGVEAQGALDGRQGLLLLDRWDPELILLDLRLPDIPGLEILHRVKQRRPDLPVIIISAHGDTRAAVEAVKAGAEDYFTKPFDLDDLLHVIRRALARERPGQEVVGPRRQDTGDTEEIIGDSSSITSLREQIRTIGHSSARSVLLLGHSGTGKALVARALHRCSARAGGPFIDVNCAALPENLLEAELFGAERGAYTGADRRRIGLAELAHQGTLFLDEIGEMPFNLQAKLLSFLDNRRFRPIGAAHEISADIRVIAATNRDIEREAEQGRFRPDLFYRLNVVTLTVPPLAERGHDVLQLAEHFAHLSAAEEGCDPICFGEPVRELFTGYRWPGNIRELRNLVERLTILYPGQTIGPEQLPSGFCTREAGPSGSIGELLEAKERDILLRTLEEAGGHRGKTARVLGISRHALKRRLKRLDIH